MKGGEYITFDIDNHKAFIQVLSRIIQNGGYKGISIYNDFKFDKEVHEKFIVFEVGERLSDLANLSTMKDEPKDEVEVSCANCSVPKNMRDTVFEASKEALSCYNIESVHREPVPTTIEVERILKITNALAQQLLEMQLEIVRASSPDSVGGSNLVKEEQDAIISKMSTLTNSLRKLDDIVRGLEPLPDL